MGPALGGGGHAPLPLGSYDTPIGTETRLDFPLGAPPPGPDPRAANPVNLLNQANWGVATAAIDLNRARNPDNSPLLLIDQVLQQNDYQRIYDNYETGLAQMILVTIQGYIANWHALNPNANTRMLRRASNVRRRARFNNANALLIALNNEVVAQLAMWAANPAPHPAMERQYRPGIMGLWDSNHPRFQPQEGMGRDRYASILELVTPGGPGYEPETVAGRANIIAAMTDAVNIATGIEAATQNFDRRVRLNTVAGVNNVTDPDIFVGNPAQPNQTTDASIQATMAIDLAQVASFFKSVVAAANKPQNLFALKHASDPGGHIMHPRRSETVMARAPLVAKNIIRNRLVLLDGGWAGNVSHLRGLFVLISQYLMMGKYSLHGGAWGLDKNIVPLLSRNDLGTVIFNQLVPPAEQALVAANLVPVRNAILAETGRNGGMAVFNQEADDVVPFGDAPFDLSCEQFIDNILAGNPDGITNNLGGFRQFDLPEGVDPTGARGGDYRHPGGGGRPAAMEREGAIFEMRNIVPADLLDLPTDRFPHAHWIALATHIADMLAALNARTVALSARDTRFRQATGALLDEPANW
jgi:hypothetical protein